MTDKVMQEQIDYDPNCILCRRGAGKADAGLSEDDLCHGHLATALREAQAEVARLRGIVSGMKYYIDNPSAWDHFSQNVSDLIAEVVRAVDSELDAALKLREGK